LNVITGVTGIKRKPTEYLINVTDNDRMKNSECLRLSVDF